MDKPEIIVVGVGIKPDLLPIIRASLELNNITHEIVNTDEAKEKGIKIMDFKPPIQLPPIEPIVLKDTMYNDGRSARNMRREAERKSKKRNKRK